MMTKQGNTETILTRFDVERAWRAQAEAVDHWEWLVMHNKPEDVCEQARKDMQASTRHAEELERAFDDQCRRREEQLSKSVLEPSRARTEAIVRDMERGELIDRFIKLHVSPFDKLGDMPLAYLKNMVEDLESAQAMGELDMETYGGARRLWEILSRYFDSLTEHEGTCQNFAWAVKHGYIQRSEVNNAWCIRAVGPDDELLLAVYKCPYCGKALDETEQTDEQETERKR